MSEPYELPAKTFRHDEDWAETIRLAPVGGDPVRTDKATLSVRLVERLRPSRVAVAVPAGEIEIGARESDGRVPVVIRMTRADLDGLDPPFPRVDADYRLDVATTREGVRRTTFTAIRRFRS